MDFVGSSLATSRGFFSSDRAAHFQQWEGAELSGGHSDSPMLNG
jgi:hypothetical protein